MSTIIYFQDVRIGIDEDIAMSGIPFNVTPIRDDNGDDLPHDKRVTQYYELDNYQAYELAMAILAKVRIRGTRGPS